jgi:5S rRNA maturation endonuclease (ribonuclease M5)
MNLSHNDIIQMLNLLGIKHNNQPNAKGWIDIVCPLHNDKDFGNAGINVKTGKISCFNCKSKIHIQQLYQNIFNQSFKGFEVVNNDLPQKQEKIKETKSYPTINDYPFEHIALAPKVNKYLYTKMREINTGFCSKFNIRHCISDPYDDYIIIPIIDKQKGIYEFEARKLKEYEMLKKFFGVENTYKNLKSFFNIYKKENKLVYRKGKIIQKAEDIEKEIFDPILYYLMTPKVKYISNSRCNETIWNIDYLDFNKRLYLIEGCGSLSKIYTYISKNVSALFGSNFTLSQIQYLKQFPEVILLPDPDDAGYQLVVDLHLNLDNLKIQDIGVEDTDKTYIERIQNYEILTASAYISKNILKFIKNS